VHRSATSVVLRAFDRDDRKADDGAVFGEFDINPKDGQLDRADLGARSQAQHTHIHTQTARGEMYSTRDERLAGVRRGTRDQSRGENFSRGAVVERGTHVQEAASEMSSQRTAFQSMRRHAHSWVAVLSTLPVRLSDAEHCREHLRHQILHHFLHHLEHSSSDAKHCLQHLLNLHHLRVVEEAAVICIEGLEQRLHFGLSHTRASSGRPAEHRLQLLK